MAGPAQGNTMMLARLLMAQKNGVPPQMQQPFMGLGGLPPYEKPGSSLPADQYISSPQPRPGPSMVPADVVANTGDLVDGAVELANTQPPAGMPPSAAQPQLPSPDAATVPAMPPSQNVRSDVMSSLAQMAKAGTLPPQFAEMFPQLAQGSMTQMRGGV